MYFYEMEYASFLRQHIEEIVRLTDDEFEMISGYFVPRKVSRKEYLIKGGQIVTSEFLVVEGLLKAFMFDDSGKEHIIQFAMENWWVSDYPAFSKQESGEICVQALETCIVLELSLEHKKKMCEEVPKMYQFHAQKAFSGYVALQKRVLSMLKNSAKEKYELLLSQYPQLFQRVSKTMIAHYLGLSRETLSRLVKEIKA
ncbi:Crp/Fnr family transcriptional regulator [Flavobacterium sediminis]|nr:Crp/Fnr family transcriptional regulator [Flavobacterium sediminis]